MNRIYLRVSTDDQADSRAGLNAQLDACVKICGGDHEVYRDEGVSGAAPLEKRPGMLELIADLKRGDVLVVAKRDRLGRDPIVVAMIERSVERRGGSVVSAAGEGTESNEPGSVLMRRMIDAFAEYERLIIGARTKAALAAKKSRGERVGEIPFGYRLKGRRGRVVERDDHEQKIIEKARALRGDGLSLRAVCGKLEEMGMVSRAGTRFNPTQVYRMVEAGNK